MPRRDQRLTVKDKLAILVEAERGTLKATARKHGVQPSQLRRWRKLKSKLEETRKRNPKAHTTAPGRPISAPTLERDIAIWIRARRTKEIAVSTADVISKALSIDVSFKGAERKVLRHWVYPFLERNNLSLRRRTHVGQKLSGHLQLIRDEFVEAVNERFRAGGTLEGLSPSLNVNMDETAVYYEQTATTTIAPTGSATVSIRGSGSNSQRLTACVSCAVNGAKLPLFLLFKAKPESIIEKSLDKLLPADVFGCCQENGWMDDRGCRIWLEKVWTPYVKGHESSLLVLDEFKSHMQPSLAARLADVGTDLMIIPGGYTSVLQPCDVGVNKPLKDSLREHYTKWSAAEMENLPADAKVPVPRREGIIPWIAEAWGTVSTQSIRDTFKKIGFGANAPPSPPAPAPPATHLTADTDIDVLVEEVQYFTF